MTVIDQHTKILDKDFDEYDVRLKLEIPQEFGKRMIYLDSDLLIIDNGVVKNFTRHEHRAVFIEALLAVSQHHNECSIEKYDGNYLRSEIKRWSESD